MRRPGRRRCLRGPQLGLGRGRGFGFRLRRRLRRRAGRRRGRYGHDDGPRGGPGGGGAGCRLRPPGRGRSRCRGRPGCGGGYRARPAVPVLPELQPRGLRPGQRPAPAALQRPRGLGVRRSGMRRSGVRGLGPRRFRVRGLRVRGRRPGWLRVRRLRVPRGRRRPGVRPRRRARGREGGARTRGRRARGREQSREARVGVVSGVGAAVEQVYAVGARVPWGRGGDHAAQTPGTRGRQHHERCPQPDESPPGIAHLSMLRRPAAVTRRSPRVHSKESSPANKPVPAPESPAPRHLRLTTHGRPSIRPAAQRRKTQSVSNAQRPVAGGGDGPLGRGGRGRFRTADIRLVRAALYH